MDKEQQPIPIPNGITWTIMGDELCRKARERGDTVVEVSPYSEDSTSTVCINVSDDDVWFEPNQGWGWTSIVLQPRPGQWMNLVVFDVDALIRALQRAKGE